MTDFSPPPRAWRRASPVRVSDDLARQLRGRILRNEFADALLPKQEDLIREYGVSAQSVREAFRMLEAEGLITVRRGSVGGALVHVPDASSTAHAVGLALQSEGATLDDVSVALLRLDALAAGACAARPDRDDAVVPRLLGEIEDAERGLEGPEWLHASMRFHHMMADLSGNITSALLVKTLFAIWEAHSEEWASVLGHTEYVGLDRRKEMTACHVELVALIEAGDVAAAERAAAEHLRTSHQPLLSKPETLVSVTRIGARRERAR